MAFRASSTPRRDSSASTIDFTTADIPVTRIAPWLTAISNRRGFRKPLDSAVDGRQDADDRKYAEEKLVEAFVRTDRLVLRRFTMSDIDSLVRLDSDPQVMRFLTGKPTPRVEIEDQVLPGILRDYQRGPAGRFAGIERSTGEFVGWLALQPAEDGSVADVELGFRLRASVWGRGYATEGACALIWKGFTELGVKRVWAQTMAVNIASRRVMVKAGLSYVRTFHTHFEDPLPGTEHGEVEYELRQADWGTGRWQARPDQEPGAEHVADHVRGGQGTAERVSPGRSRTKNTNARGAIATGSFELTETTAQQKTARVAKLR